MFNLQSGTRKQQFPPPPPKRQVQNHRGGRLVEELSHHSSFNGKHRRSITGIEVDNLNRSIFSCSEDGILKFWDFASGKLVHELDWSLTSLSALRFHRPTDLIAVACKDQTVRIVDASNRTVVRELQGSEYPIFDLCFSNDGRWVVSVSGDSILRVYDLSTGDLIDALRFCNQPTSVSLSPTGEYLATAHKESSGVHIFTNKTLFSNIPTRRIDINDAVDIDIPAISGEGRQAWTDHAFGKEDARNDDVGAGGSSLAQLSSDLLKLSLTPKVRWQTLLHIDAIKSRNKPKEPPKTPQVAPFFLPSIDRDRSTLGLERATTLQEQGVGSHISVKSNLFFAGNSIISRLLADFQTTHNVEPMVLYLSSLPPSAADTAVRALQQEPPYTELIRFVQLLIELLNQRQSYDLAQTWMAVFLRCHSSAIPESEALNDSLDKWKKISTPEAARFGQLLGFTKGVVDWVAGLD